ncbi:MAG TPA: PadR family transcriptional regulator [Steroidobacteraceae bacterium]|jgi:DNA-binding PadR family transcriptional regulator|nr:PadR family transcriptional regulator [Steroidobacteraceae bacterium]
MHHHFYHCVGRHHGRHGVGRFGRGFMEGGSTGGRGFGMGRKLASGDLQLLILKLLDEKSRYGYEIIKELDERSKGFYVPSPGMVYPALTYLEEIGHATVAVDGARKLYSITETGKEDLAKNLATADALFAQFGRVGERMDRVRRALDAEDGGEEPDQERHGSRELHRARHDLKLALAGKRHSSREEQQRIAAILARAAAEIAGE